MQILEEDPALDQLDSRKQKNTRGKSTNEWVEGMKYSGASMFFFTTKSKGNHEWYGQGGYTRRSIQPIPENSEVFQTFSCECPYEEN